MHGDMDFDIGMAYSNSTLPKTGRRKLLKVGLRYAIFVYSISLNNTLFYVSYSSWFIILNTSVEALISIST